MSVLNGALRVFGRLLRPGLGQLHIHAPRPVRLPIAPITQWPDDLSAPKVTIVVPSFNQARFLRRTLESIIEQDYPELELIVIDGGSTDGSQEIIAHYSGHITWWVSEPDCGQADALNKGFARASGEILAWINSDDLIAPGALHEVAGYFARHPEIDVVYGDRLVIDELEQEVGHWILPGHSAPVLRWVDFVPQETLYWRRGVWERAGAQLDTALQFALDWDLVLRLLAVDARFVHLPRVLGLFRTHPAQKTVSAIRDTGRREMDSLRQRVLGFSPGRWSILCRVVPYLLGRTTVRARLDSQVQGQPSQPEACAMNRCAITIVVPSLNQGRYLREALDSALQQEPRVEVFVMDGGSTDGSVEIIRSYAHRLAGWRSAADGGQAAAINEGIALGHAPYVCWLNSDDWLLPGGLAQLFAALEQASEAPAAYGRAWNHVQANGRRKPVWVEPFSEPRMAQRCIVCQPATLIRRSAWEAVGGLDASKHMAMDYDLWWRLFRRFGPLHFVDAFVAVNRDHELTKTRQYRARHYREAIDVVRRHHGKVPLKWWLAQPYSVWLRSLIG